MHCTILGLLSGCLAATVAAANFDFEADQLQPSDSQSFSAVSFASSASSAAARTDAYTNCLAVPGNADWPTPGDWSQLNTTVNGTLLQPAPLGAACYKTHPAYDAARCATLVRTAGFSRAYLDDPLAVLSPWTEGDTCPVASNPRGNCTQGGFPVYVVRATTVRHIQAAVNFARNKNVRLVIKNTGHDFGGRSTGAASLSIWTHNLKGFRYLPYFSLGQYRGAAVYVGAGLEGNELFNYMATYGITVAGPGDGTVGVGGGWIAGGGHGLLVSYLGLGSDQVLSMQVVTADGRFVTASPMENSDLFFALRGGGGSTYGVVTSLVLKAYPPVQIISSGLGLSTYARPAYNYTVPGTNGTNTTVEIPATHSALTPDKFWAGVSAYYRFGPRLVDAGGLGYTYVRPLGNGSYTFTAVNWLPGLSARQARRLMAPLYAELNALGLAVAAPRSYASMPYATRRPLTGDGPANTRYRSRLFPRANWENGTLYDATFASIRAAIEAGHTFHGMLQSPNLRTAGWPGRDSAVNPAYRAAVLHGSLISEQPAGISAAEATRQEDAAQGFVQKWRDLTPGAGSYMNEGDPLEPGWQQSFYGNLYPTLVAIKQKWDPLGVFWAPTTPGSENWVVRPVDGIAGSQNGPLCWAGS